MLTPKLVYEEIKRDFNKSINKHFSDKENIQENNFSNNNSFFNNFPKKTVYASMDNSTTSNIEEIGNSLIALEKLREELDEEYLCILHTPIGYLVYLGNVGTKIQQVSYSKALRLETAVNDCILKVKEYKEHEEN